MLYLIPTHLGNTDNNLLAPQIKATIESCDILLAENLKTARHFLKSLGVAKKIDDYQWLELTKDTASDVLTQYMKLINNKRAGIISEAGVPAVADPGAALVSLAQLAQIQVVPISGPSSILLALMASGFNGQQFTFNGYLPIQSADRIKKIAKLEQLATQGITQIFIETPYRNNSLLKEILQHGQADTKLCIATDITLPTEFIVTKAISHWKKNIPDLNKRPTVFLMG